MIFIVSTLTRVTRSTASNETRDQGALRARKAPQEARNLAAIKR
jgi:hypothetical protein